MPPADGVLEPLRYPDGTGDVDSEGVTLAGGTGVCVRRIRTQQCGQQHQS